MAASVHRLQLVHSATSMIMFHFFIADTLIPVRYPEVRAQRASKGDGWGASVGILRGPRSVSSGRPLRAGRWRPPQDDENLSFRRQQVCFLERAFDFLVLLRCSKSRRHMLGAAVP